MHKQSVIKASGIGLALFSLMAFSDAKISARNAESLDASLQSILQPLSQIERMEFMGAFFDYAYFEDCKTKIGQPIHSSLNYSLKYCQERINGQRDMAMTYIGDRRMDDKIEYITTSLLTGTQHHGHSASKSYTLFIERYGQHVDGKSANQILSAIRTEGAIGDQSQRADIVAAAEAKIIELQTDIAQWEENLPKIGRLGSRLGTDGQGQKYEANCQKSIAYAKTHLAEQRARLDGDYTRLRGVWPPTGYEGNCMRVNGVRGSGWIELSPLPATTQITAAEQSAASKAMYKGALNAIHMDSLQDFQTKERRTGLEVSFKPSISFESPRDKAVKRVEYSLAVIPRSDHFSMVAIKGRALKLRRTGGNFYSAEARLSNKTLSRNYEAFIGASRADFHILPYIRVIEYEDGTKDYIVENDDDMLHFLKNITADDVK